MSTIEANYNKFVDFNRNNVFIGKSPNGYGLTYFTRKDFLPEEIVMKSWGKIINRQTRHFSVQIDFNKHILPTKWTSKYFNHSCEPNCFVKSRKDGFPDFVAIRKIKKNEELTFAYWMTEYEWSKNAAEKNIKCKCGSNSCKRKILSYSQLSEKDKAKHQKYISEYLQSNF